jgi:hypothetical protein
MSHRPRHSLGTGLRVRSDLSLVADAQRRFRVAAAQDELMRRALKRRLLPDPPPQAGEGTERPAQAGEGTERLAQAGGGTERLAQAGSGTPTELTARARALYEAGVVPVAAIARLCGVHQRTLYKYVARGGWRRRYQAAASAAASLAKARKPFRTAQGAGGRFIRSELAGLPHRSGMKALDPAGEAQALAACERAAALSDAALARAIARRDGEVDARTFAALVRVVRDLAAIEDRGGAGGRPSQNKKRAARRHEPLRVLPAGPLPKAVPEPEPLSDQARRINEIAARYYDEHGRGIWTK